ncbi:hypothetical protein S40285_08828 [Stachybotrys chlorohalonatus IBT 40285]|uniref:GH16 domain-containing protein n=1 Tax=Stachybotrys chlorohalonatus (strain IBT 40285) TaxID=1283841 RepID=A0A084QS58_STAC4|nr:hypothetical protein S40285_08828 [Stachybotrys chlorohalonata IBT 40285]
MLWLLNFVLVAVPIGTTAGVLVGLQAQRDANGQEPLFGDQPGFGGGAGGGSGPPRTTRIDVDMYCDTSIGISPPSVGDHYTFNPNPWGWEEGEEGRICMNITTFRNETYATTTSAPEWSVSWSYPPGPESAPVHAFPNVKVDNQVFPARIQDIDRIDLDFEWTYVLGNDTSATTSTSEAELDEHSVNANVALDIFIDSDRERSQNSSAASAEIMVWFAAFGPATQPIGLIEGSLANLTVNGTEFSLYNGENSLGQKVHTWMSAEPAERFHGDLFVLVDHLMEMDNDDFPNRSDYIGYLSLGTEAYFSEEVVTFHVPELAIEVQLLDN